VTLTPFSFEAGASPRIMILDGFSFINTSPDPLNTFSASRETAVQPFAVIRSDISL